MLNVIFSAFVSCLFLIANAVILILVLVLNLRENQSPGLEKKPDQGAPGDLPLNPSDILGWEFEYARITASEAMQDRHTMVNFYLLATGVVASGVIAVLGKDSRLPTASGTLLLWLLCQVGWLYFLKIIRLRQAWHDSVRTMNQIKDFYIKHVQAVQPEVLGTAFQWRSETLPPPDKKWTVYFYSATLIGFLDSVAFGVGGALINLQATLNFPWLTAMLFFPLWLAFFAFHIWLYFAFLKPKPTPATTVERRLQTV